MELQGGQVVALLNGLIDEILVPYEILSGIQVENFGIGFADGLLAHRQDTGLAADTILITVIQIFIILGTENADLIGFHGIASGFNDHQVVLFLHGTGAGQVSDEVLGMGEGRERLSWT